MRSIGSVGSRVCVAAVVVGLTFGVLTSPALASRQARDHGAVRAASSLTVSMFGSATFTSSTHLTLPVFVEASNSLDGKPSFAVSVSRGSFAQTTITRKNTSAPQTFESHSWRFVLSKASFVYNQSAGTATVSTGTQMNPYGTSKLSFTKTSSKAGACKTGSEVIDQGKLTGTLFFNTNGKAWGSRGSKTKQLALTTAVTLTFDNQ